MINAKEFVAAFAELQEKTNIPADVIIDALKQSLILAYQKKFKEKNANINAKARVEVDETNGSIRFYAQKDVIDKPDDNSYDSSYEILLSDAKKIKKDAKVGDVIEKEIPIDDFQRMAVMYIKQNLKQQIKEAEKKVIYEQFHDKVYDIFTGIVEKVEPRILINFGTTNAVMPARQRIPTENYYVGQQIRVYILSVDKNQVVVSRTAPGLLKCLFDREITEVHNGLVDIKKIARIPGERAKVAVFSTDPNIDAPGACIGQKGMRIQNISNQLANEKIDVIQYYDEPELFIAEALKPAEVLGLILEKNTADDTVEKSDLNEDEDRQARGRKGRATVVVANDDFSLAVGRKGQNVSLAARITDYNIDIKTVDEALAERLNYRTISDIRAEYALKYRQEEAEELALAPEVIESEEVPVDASEPVVEVLEDTAKVEEKKVSEDIVPPLPKEESHLEDILARMPTPKIKAEHIPVVEESQPEEVEKPAEKKTVARKSNKAKKKEEEAKAKAKEEEARKNYMPVYTEEELKAIQEEEEAAKRDDYDDDYDEEDYDEYYD